MKTTTTPLEEALNEELDGYDASPKERAMMRTIVEATLDLVRNHWPQIKETREQCAGEAKVGINATIDVTGKKPLIKTRITYATRHTDEREDTIEDPNQKELGIGR